MIEGKKRHELTDSLELESSLTCSRYEISPRSRYVFPATNSTWFLNDFKYGIGRAFTWDERITWQPSERLHMTGGISLSNLDILPKATIPGGADPDKDLAAQGGSFSYYARAGDATSRVDVPRVNNVKYQQYGAYLESRWQAHHCARALLRLHSMVKKAGGGPGLNAIKYSKKDGTIWVRSRGDKKFLTLGVEDQCGGLPKGKAEELFQPFTQKGADRSRLGLTISRQAISRIGGELMVRDLPGKGCVFSISLPKQGSKPSTKESAEHAAAGS